MNYVTYDDLLDIVGSMSDKVNNYVKFSEWAANTSYSVGDIILYDGQIYKVTTAFTSSTTFSDTNLEKYLPKSMTAQEIQDAIAAYTPPLNVGGSINYSTTEQRIGTWIDGKPLYQKTLTGTLPQVQIGGSIVIATLPDVETVIDIRGGFNEQQNPYQFYPLFYNEYNTTSGVATLYQSIYFQQADGNDPAQLILSGSGWVSTQQLPYNITIQYTKGT